MAIDSNFVFKVVESARGKAVTVDDVLMRARLEPGAKPHVRRLLRGLVQEGKLELEGKRFKAPQPAQAPAEPQPSVRRGRRERPERSPVSADKVPELPPDPVPAMPKVSPSSRPDARVVVGTLTRTSQGYGFIAQLTGGDDLFVPPQNMGDALDGDLVEARVGPGRDGRPVAKAMRVVERRRQYAVGTYRETTQGPHRKLCYVEPRDQQLGPAIVVEPAHEVKDGDIVRVRLESFEAGELRGTVASRVGLPGDPNVEVLSVAYGEGFSDIFPPDVLRAAEHAPDHVRQEDKQARRDLTGLDLVTIDSEDARDFDDAIFVERTPRGWRLVVAIADVTAYVPPGGALDREATRRATSVYFPRHVLPMLPERLSNGICSLNPDVERLCMVADMALDPDGNPRDTELYPAVMRSKARCTYTKVAQILDGEQVPDLAHVHDMLRQAGELAKKLTRMRMNRGAIDFDLPESHILLGPDGEVAAIVKRGRNQAHRLVEEFMLAANEAVARYFESRALPTVFRVHGSPKEEKLRTFVELANTFGYELATDQAGKISAAELNEFLHRVEGKPEQRALNHLLLRSMMQAVYSAENIGHFGLAAESYLHFTSPIRRYPDLVVHRLLKEHWARAGRVLPEDARGKQAEELNLLAVHCSERERASTSAEREIDAFYAASYMATRVGEHFHGTVASVTEFGLFVELDDPFVEGLVRAETLGPETTFDADHHRLSAGDLSFTVGERVEIAVESSNPITRRIDLRLVSVEGKPAKHHPVAERPRKPVARGGARPGKAPARGERKGPPRKGGERKAASGRGGREERPTRGAPAKKQRHQKRGGSGGGKRR